LLFAGGSLDRQLLLHLAPMSSNRDPSLPESLQLDGDRKVLLLDLIGRGRAGAVLEAVVIDGEGARRPAAVKVFETNGEDDCARVRARLARRAAVATSFDHPNAVKLMHVDLEGKDGAPLFAVMELVSGATLEEVLRLREPTVALPFALGVAVGLSVSSALAAASARGLLHGAIAPSEIHVTPEGVVKLGGLGCDAGRTAASSEVRAFDVHDGRVTSMSPEVADGAAPDARSEVFALGVVLHELLVAPRFGHLASRADAMQLLHDGVVPEPLFAAQMAPGPVRRFLRRATAARSADRFASAAEMHAELASVARTLGVTDDAEAVRAAMRDALRPAATTSWEPRALARASRR
jgi:serine/threonine-protein kinase